MIAYADTGFLISLYGRDGNSTVARQLMASRPVFLLTPLGEAEFANAVEGLVFRKYWFRSDADSVITQFHQQLSAGVFRSTPLVPEVWDRASELSRLHTAAIGTRTLDVLHVATAELLKAEAFFTFDKRQARLAHAIRLGVRPSLSAP